MRHRLGRMVWRTYHLALVLYSTDTGASTSNAASSAKVTDYLVGAQLDEALAAGHDLVVSWPLAEGDVSDYTQAEALWYVHTPR